MTSPRVEERRLLNIRQESARFNLDIKQLIEVKNSEINNDGAVVKAVMLLRHAIEILELSLLYTTLWHRLKEA